eukprot:4855985-Prymnesium_polylepis.1
MASRASRSRRRPRLRQRLCSEPSPAVGCSTGPRVHPSSAAAFAGARAPHCASCWVRSPCRVCPLTPKALDAT